MNLTHIAFDNLQMPQGHSVSLYGSPECLVCINSMTVLTKPEKKLDDQKWKELIQYLAMCANGPLCLTYTRRRSGIVHELTLHVHSNGTWSADGLHCCDPSRLTEEPISIDEILDYAVPQS